MTESLIDQAKSIEPWIVEIRRRLHQCPELGYELPETATIVGDELQKLGIDFQCGIAESGIVATIGAANGNDSCVMLRADMDGLPIEEMADVEFRSRNSGTMHACGHDCHTAMLLGAARILKAQESHLPHAVKLCFQPAEEGGAGARRMCDEGVLRNPDVNSVFGLHVWPLLPTGMLTGRPGPFLAATSDFEISVFGSGGHAAMPQLAIDPVVTAARIINDAQSLISREQDPLQPGVISFTSIHGGTATNVIPETVRMRGTVRSLSTENRDHLKTRLREMADATAQAHRCTSEFLTLDEEYPETSNDAELWKRVHAIGTKLVGSDNFPICSPVLAGEDFSFYGKHVPTCFVALGIQNHEVGSVFGLHHPQFKVDESALHIGTAMHCAFAM